MYQSIIEKQNQIFLEEESHTYKLLNSKINFASVTEFINTFFKPFNEKKIAAQLSGKGTYKHMTSEDILNDWEERRDRGTIVHKEIETFIKNIETGEQSKNLDLKSQQGVSFVKEKCLNSNNLLFSEVKIFSEELKLAGTIDLMLYNKEHDKIYLIDWKTNVSIKKIGYNKGILSPADTMDDCSFNRYKLQLSIYRYILENYYNASVNGLYIVHLTNEHYKVMECSFEKQHVTDMMQLRSN